MPASLSTALRLHLEITATPTWQSAVPALPQLARRAILATLSQVRWPATLPVHVSLLLTTNPRMQQLNMAWRGKNKPTNVLSFPQLAPAPLAKIMRTKNTSQATPAPVALGDLALGYQTMAREAKAAEKPLKAHMAHLLVHGMLHLLGYDHETNAKDAAKMEKTEIKILRTLGYPNPYLNYDH